MGVYKRGESWNLDIYYEGRRIRKKIVGARTKSDAHAALAATKTDILRGEFNFKGQKRILFEDFAKEYLEYVKVNKKSWVRNEASLKNFMPHFEGMSLSKITPKHIEAFKRKRLNEDKVQPNTINRDLGCLRHLFNIAIKFRNYDSGNPVKEVKFFQERQYEMKILNKEEYNELISVSNGYLKPIIILALNTGMRRGEIFNLRWNDVDFTKHYIFIKETKSGYSRKIPMNSLVTGTLKIIERESEFVFCNPKTKNHLKSVWRSFKTACKNASVPDLRFHDLRHTAATLMVTGGVDLVTVKEILGHSRIEMTMRYAHPTPENKINAVNVLASIFEPEERKLGTIQTQESRGDVPTHLLTSN